MKIDKSLLTKHLFVMEISQDRDTFFNIDAFLRLFFINKGLYTVVASKIRSQLN